MRLILERKHGQKMLKALARRPAQPLDDLIEIYVRFARRPGNRLGRLGCKFTCHSLRKSPLVARTCENGNWWIASYGTIQ